MANTLELLDYVECRDTLNAKFQELVTEKYGKNHPNHEQVDQTATYYQVELECAEHNETSEEFVKGMLGFINWSQNNPKAKETITNGDILVNLFHDFSEFVKNRNEDWFCPRSHGYIKFFRVIF